MKKTEKDKTRDISEGLLQIFFAGWVFNKLPDDYGLDFLINITKEENVIEYSFFVQLKGSKSLNYKDSFFNFVMKTKHLQYYVKNPIPILLIIFDVNTQTGYWINIQKYIRDVLNIQDPIWIKQKTKTIKIPFSNKLTDLTIIREEIIQSANENMLIYVENMKWPAGFENFLENPDRIIEVINKTEIENIKRRIHSSLLYFRMDNIREMQNQFFEIYKLKKRDRHHLQAILAIITSSNIFTEKIDTFLNLTNEGLQLSEELKDQLYINIFTFFFHYYSTFDILVKQQIPNMLKRIEATKKSNQIDLLIKLIWESENIALNNVLNEHSKKILEILNMLLESGNIFEYHTLSLHLLQIEVFLNSILKDHIEMSVFSKVLEKNEQFIQLLIELSQKFEIIDTQLHTYLLTGGYYEAYNQNKAEEYYQKGLEIAKNSNHQYYIKKFSYNLENLGSISELFTLNDVIKIPLSRTMEILKNFKLSNLNSIEDTHIKGSLKLALNDLNPVDFLKKCKNFLVGYYPSVLGQVEGIYSLGLKRVTCEKHKIIYESGNLKNIFDLYEKKYCSKCDKIHPRENNYDPPTSIISEMTKRINEIAQNSSVDL